MSHFSVAVFTKEGGKTVDELLAPYNENLKVPKYVVYTKEALIQKSRKEVEEYATKGNFSEWLKDPESYEKKYPKKGHLKYLKEEFPQKLNWSDEEHYKDQIKYYAPEEIGENGEVYSNYNPKSKWDWYQIGGRWYGLLKLNTGCKGERGEKSWLNKDKIIGHNFVDSARIKDIDFSIDQESDEYKRALRFWEINIEKERPKDDEEKNEYWSMYRKEYYTERYRSKEDYATKMCTISTFAVIDINGMWYEKGEMGWFGFDSATGEDALNWDEGYFERFIKNQNPNTIMTIVDCHI